MNKKTKNIDVEWQYSDLSKKRKGLLSSMKDWKPVVYELARLISTEDYIENGWRSCLDSHMDLIIDSFPAADAIWLYMQIYKWVETMEGSSNISDDDKSFIHDLVKSYAIF